MTKHKLIPRTAVMIASVLAAVLLGGAVSAAAHTGTADINGPVSTEQAVIYENVEMRRYEGKSGHPYIHDIKTNGTDRGIAGFKQGKLSFDRDGNPLKIDWWSLDSDLEYEYFYLYENDSSGLAAGGTDDVFGGWSLNLMGKDNTVADISYILYCDKQITFEDGTVWENPDFESWLSTYCGKKTDVKVLENYYPYVEKIEFNDAK